MYKLNNLIYIRLKNMLNNSEKNNKKDLNKIEKRISNQVRK